MIVIMLLVAFQSRLRFVENIQRKIYGIDARIRAVIGVFSQSGWDPRETFLFRQRNVIHRRLVTAIDYAAAATKWLRMKTTG